VNFERFPDLFSKSWLALTVPGAKKSLRGKARRPPEPVVLRFSTRQLLTLSACASATQITLSTIVGHVSKYTYSTYSLNHGPDHR